MSKELVCVKKVNLSWDSLISRRVKCRIIQVKKIQEWRIEIFAGVVDYQAGAGCPERDRRRRERQAEVGAVGYSRALWVSTASWFGRRDDIQYSRVQ